MYIKSIRLKGYKRFNTSQISEFSCKFDKKISIIVGSNGSGKSSLLQALSPLPARRADFDSEGLQELIIEHDGIEYILTSDFTKRNHTHSFLINGEEFNISGNEGLQKELVEKYFGFTETIGKLVTNKLSMCKSSKADRTKILQEINPQDTQLIKDLFDKVRKLYSASSTQLDTAKKKASDNAANMIKPDELSKYEDAERVLSEAHITLTGLIMSLKSHCESLRNRYSDLIQNISEKLKNNHDPNLQKESVIFNSSILIKKLRNILHNFYKFDFIDKTKDFYEQRDVYVQEKIRYESEQKSLTSEISNLENEVSQYEKILVSASNDENSTSILESKLKEYEELLQTFDIDNLPKYYIHSEDIQRHTQVAEDIKTALFQFIDSHCRMIYPNLIRDKIDKRNNLFLELSSIKKSLTDTTNSIEEATKRLVNLQLTSGISLNCKDDSCKLRMEFKKSVQHQQSYIESLKHQYQEYQTNQENIEKQYKEINTYLEPFEKYNLLYHFSNLESWLSNTLFHYLNYDTDSLLDTINTQPMLIHKRCIEFIYNSEKVSNYNDIHIKYEACKKQLETAAKHANTSIEFIKEQYNEKSKLLKQKINKSIELTEKISAANLTLDKYTQYNELVTTYQELKQEYNNGVSEITLYRAMKFFNHYYRGFVAIDADVNERLMKIKQIVRNQKSYRDIFEDANKDINKYAIEKGQYEKLRLAFDPMHGMLQNYMVTYVNCLINNINKFAAEIWTSNFKIIPLTLEDEIGDFDMEIGNYVRKKALDKLSDGQTEAMNLLWMLALLYQLRMLNKLPLYTDELGRTFDTIHRINIIKFLQQLVDQGAIAQLFMVNHFATMTGGFTDYQVICLDENNLKDIPEQYKANVIIIR